MVLTTAGTRSGRVGDVSHAGAGRAPVWATHLAAHGSGRASNVGARGARRGTRSGGRRRRQRREQNGEAALYLA
jgi:hypothetical protein